MSKLKCEWCDSEFDKREHDYAKFDLCDACYSNCDDKTGYCSIGCCMGTGCDGSC